MEQLIEQLILGNCTIAKHIAKGHGWREIFMYLRHELGYGERHATCCADFLKGKGSFQRYCDASFEDKQHPQHAH